VKHLPIICNLSESEREGREKGREGREREREICIQPANRQE